MKKIKKTFLYLFGFAFALLAFTIIINMPVFDEELLSEVQAIKEIKAQPFSEDNAYPALYAINSASGANLMDASKIIRDHLNNQIVKTGTDFLSGKDNKNLIGKGHDDSWNSTFNYCNSRKESGCMIAMAKDLISNPITDQRLLSQLQRYEALLDYSTYSDARQGDMASLIPAFGLIFNLQKFYLTEAFTNKTTNDYLSAWQKDMAFWRMISSHSHMLITKMIAIAAIRTNMDSLSTAIKQGTLSFEQLAQLQANIETLAHNEFDLSTTFEFEFKYVMNTLDREESDKSIGMTEWINFYQPKATLNFNYLHVTKVLKKISALKTQAYYQYQESAQYQSDMSAITLWSPTMLYNPTGKLMVSYAFPAYNDYIGRGHDLNGMFYLLKLQIEIALNPEQDIEQVIAQSQYTNPYTLEPMSYNKDSHSIYFDCMDKHSICELSL